MPIAPTMMLRKTLTWHYVLIDNFHVLVSVRSRVLVPEADHVTELVNYDAELVTVLADTDRLVPVPALTHKRTTSGNNLVNRLKGFKPVYN